MHPTSLLHENIISCIITTLPGRWTFPTIGVGWQYPIYILVLLSVSLFLVVSCWLPVPFQRVFVYAVVG